MYPPKKGYPKSCVRYLELTTHKTPFLPHRYELDQTSTTFFQHKENTSAVHKFGVLSSNIRLLFNGHRWRETESRDFVETRKRKAVEETDTGNISTQL